MTKTWKQWTGGAAVAAAVVGGIYFAAPAFMDAPNGTGASSATAAVTASAGAAGAPAPAPASLHPWLSASAFPDNTTTVSPLSTMSPPVFATDSRGKLVLNADTHANIEKLLLETDPVAMRANLDKAAGKLSPQAAAELKVVVEQFQQYTKALPHTIAPDDAPETEQGRLQVLERLHTLRVSYLGAEAAGAMFGEEEATTRKLIGLMAAETDPSLTTEEKASRAQEILSNTLPPKPPPSP